MFKKHRNNKGFTLVEVIVVAVIVAVLALVAIQLYQGYVAESRRNTAENLAASAAGFLQTLVNARDAAYADGMGSLAASAQWSGDLDGDGTGDVFFTCPANASITIVVAGGTVTATVGGVSATGTYQYK